MPTFINAAVGAPLTLRVDGDGNTSSDGDVGVEGREGPTGVAPQIQGQAQGQWYPPNQTHGAYFYAMSSPKRRTPTGMEPQGYFDPLYFPAGVNVGGHHNLSVGESALVNEIMKDGHAQSLGVDGGPGKDEGTGGGGEEETHVSDDGDDEKDDEGDDDADGDADDSGKGEDQDQEARDTSPPSFKDKEGDRRSTKGASFAESIISRTQSLPTSNGPYHHTWMSMDSKGKGRVAGLGVQVHSDLEKMIENAPHSIKTNGSLSAPMLGQGCGQDTSEDDDDEIWEIGR